MPPLEKSVVNDCVAAVIMILNMNCENPSRACASCKRCSKCRLSVKIAHDAFCGVAGLPDDIDHTNWHIARVWQENYSRISWVNVDHKIIKKEK